MFTVLGRAKDELEIYKGGVSLWQSAAELVVQLDCAAVHSSMIVLDAKRDDDIIVAVLVPADYAALARASSAALARAALRVCDVLRKRAAQAGIPSAWYYTLSFKGLSCMDPKPNPKLNSNLALTP